MEDKKYYICWHPNQGLRIYDSEFDIGRQMERFPSGPDRFRAWSLSCLPEITKAEIKLTEEDAINR